MVRAEEGEVQPEPGGEGEAFLDSADPAPANSMPTCAPLPQLYAANSVPTCAPFPLLRHTLTHTGQSFERHYAAMQIKLYRVDTWRVFLSKRPLTAVFATYWARLMSIGFGLLILFSDGSAKMTFEAVDKVAVRQASMLRFTAFKLRNGEQHSIPHPGVASIGALQHGCRVLKNHTISQNASSLTVAFAENINFDGWFFVTARSAPELDPSHYVLEYSEDGTVWREAASSRYTCRV